jgi:hypothetical protein
VADLTQYGYRAEEFFLDGVAERFLPAPGSEFGWAGRWQVQPAGTAPYKTRLVVLRPEDPAAFNGTVVMSWNNVTAGYDNFGGGDSPELLEGGYAFVAVTAQRVGVHGVPGNPQGLSTWDPDRYGSLSIPSDDYSFDIFTQAASVIAPTRPRQTPDPMGGLEVRRVIAQGASQSAGRLATYVNAIQPRTGIIDGFLLTLYFGTGAPIEVGEATVTLPEPGSEESTQRPALIGTHLLRDDLDVPVMVVNSECEAMSCYGVRQPDTDRYRYWEVAGTSHVCFQAMESVVPRYRRDFGVVPPVGRGINEVPMAPVVDAALYLLNAWVQDGTPPPAQPRIEFEGDPPEIRRDEHRIARGGIRLPQVEVPLAHNSAVAASPGFLGRLGGSCVLFPPEKVRALYGDRATYLARFEEATRAAEKAAVIRERDVEPLLAEASANVPLEPVSARPSGR